MLNSEEYNQKQNMLHSNPYNQSNITTKYKNPKSNLESLCNKYTTHIRNLNALDKKMIEAIAIMSDEEKMEIITSLNDVVEYTIECLHLQV